MYSREKNLIPDILIKAYETCIKPYLDITISVYEKGTNDIVTRCDLKSQEFIIEQLRSLFPSDSILAEENVADEEAMSAGQRTWVVDPIDGTVNFAAGVPIYGIQIALVEDRQPVFAALYLPAFGEMYLAEKGQGATCNGEPIHVSADMTTSQSLVSFGDLSPRDPNIRSAQLKNIPQLSEHIRRLRMFGAACFDFISLAAGQTQAHIMYSHNPWDIFPGWLLVTEAGGVSDYDPLHPEARIICAANSEILNDLLKILNETK